MTMPSELPATGRLAGIDYGERRIGIAVPVETVTPDEACARFDAALPVVPLAERTTAEAGRPDESS